MLVARQVPALLEPPRKATSGPRTSLVTVLHGVPCACLCNSPSKPSPCGMGHAGVSASAPCPHSCPVPALQHEAATSQNVLVREACYRILGEGWSHVGQHISFSDWYRTELRSLLQQGDVQVRHCRV